MRPSNRQGASMRSLRKAARKVAVVQWPCGTLSRGACRAGSMRPSPPRRSPGCANLGEVERFETEGLDGGENVVGGFGPAEALGVGVDGVEVGEDRGFQFRGRAVDVATDLLFGDVGEEALDLIDPGAGGRREVNMPSRPRAVPLSDRLGLVSGVVVHHEVDVEAARDIALDFAQGSSRTRVRDDGDSNAR